jgi:hypothetical protein
MKSGLKQHRSMIFRMGMRLFPKILLLHDTGKQKTGSISSKINYTTIVGECGNRL